MESMWKNFKRQREGGRLRLNLLSLSSLFAPTQQRFAAKSRQLTLRRRSGGAPGEAANRVDSSLQRNSRSEQGRSTSFRVLDLRQDTVRSALIEQKRQGQISRDF